MRHTFDITKLMIKHTALTANEKIPLTRLEQGPYENMGQDLVSPLAIK